MAGYTIERIAAIVHGQLQQQGCNDVVITYLLTDSRKVVEPAHSLFFALSGSRRSGHQFIPELYARGVRCFVVAASFDTGDYTDACFIRVTDVLTAFQTLAAVHRSAYNLPVIGITGSNGKTIVKDWLNQLLEKDFHIVRSPRSYNSQIGVPLSVWQINDTHTLGIFEAGISEPDEMQSLQTIIRPTLGILTHMGDAHFEHFTNQQQKIREKLLLFRNVRCLIANGDDPLVVEAVTDAGIPCLFWGKTTGCAVSVTGIKKEATNTTIRLNLNQELVERFVAVNPASSTSIYPPSSLTFCIPFIDDASVENAITCCCLLLVLGQRFETIINRMGFLKPVEMRLELKKGINNCSVINDSYIADISSLRIALDFLAQQQQHKKHTVILSDFAEAQDEDQLYYEISLILGNSKIDRFIGIGEKMEQYQNQFEKAIPETSFYNSTADFIAQFHSSQFREESILVKGARTFALERIITLLELKAHQTILEVNLTSIVHNLKQYQQLLLPSTRIMVMVKAFSYGSGGYEIANILQFHKVDYLAVAYTDEGVELRKSGIHLPIMVMNPEVNSFAALTAHHLEPELFSFPILRHFQEHLASEGLQHYPVHIKIDTGMHRLGFEPTESKLLANTLSHNNLLRVQSVFSHLAGSEDPSMDEFTRHQAEQYLAVCHVLESHLPYRFLKHLANSAAIKRHPSLHFDMVRLGIGLYGVDSTGSEMPGLKEAATLKTTIAQIKHIPAGETVGYSRKGTIKKDSIVATIRIGYADGFRRSFSNGNGYVLIRGQVAPVIGNVAMDMTMVDITDIPGVTEEDTVIIFGEELSVSILAAQAGTIPYEIMTGISQRVLRVYFEE